MAAGEERGKVVVSERAGPECEGRKAYHQNAAEVLLPTPIFSPPSYISYQGFFVIRFL